MDYRWRTNHNAKPLRIGVQHPVDRQPADRPLESFHQLVNPRIVTTDVRFYHAEIDKLRQLLSSVQGQLTQQSDQLLRSAEQSLACQESELSSQIYTLKRHNELLEYEACESKQNYEQRSALLRSKLDVAQQWIRSSSQQIDGLKGELKNVALTASAEQNELTERHRAFVECQNLVVDEKDDCIETLESQVAFLEDSIAAWQNAHQQSVDLCEWFDRLHWESDHRIADLQSQYSGFRERTTNTFVIYDKERELLDATVAVLRTDHEAVELNAADLDHQNDELRCTIDQLQRDFQSVATDASRDRQARQATNTRLTTVAEEKMSLIGSLAKLKARSDEHDAMMFAKDQEIDATKRHANTAQNQLQQLRREHTAVTSQNDQMRNQIRESTANVNRLESAASAATDRIDQAETTLSQRDRQLREIQSSARAAEATAKLQANEEEQQFAIELQRLEDELEQRIAVHTRERNVLNHQIEQLQSYRINGRVA